MRPQTLAERNSIGNQSGPTEIIPCRASNPRVVAAVSWRSLALSVFLEAHSDVEGKPEVLALYVRDHFGDSLSINATEGFIGRKQHRAPCS